MKSRACVWTAALLALAVREASAAITVQFDYTYDSSGFFTGANSYRQTLLNDAAAAMTSRMANEHYSAIVPSFPNTWSLMFANPSTGSTVNLSNPTIPADTMTVWVGARNLGGALGIAGSTGWGAGGTQAWIDLLDSKNTSTHYEPMDGTIAFDSSANWYFDPDPTTLESFPTQYDFYSVVQHELGHLFGFTHGNNAFANQTIGSSFFGPRSMALYGGAVPLGGDISHWQQGVISPTDRVEVAMDPAITNGQRKNFTELDYAALQDVDYQISPVAGWINLGGSSDHFTATELVGNITGTAASSVLIDSGVTITSLSVNVGTLQINGTHVIEPNTSLTNRTSTAATLTIGGTTGAWTGKLDLTNNNLIVGIATNTPSFASVEDQIRQAAGVPNPANPWDGAGGITSSSAAAASTGITKTALGYATGAEYSALTTLTLFDGLVFNSTDTLIKYTLVGDANLDGTVNINDFFALSGHFNQPGDWSQGNFNYAGNVDISDFFAMSGNFGHTLAVGDLLPAGGASAAAAAAPEPSALLLLGLGAAGLAVRRRRGATKTQAG